jgi:hypothetical protein
MPETIIPEDARQRARNDARDAYEKIINPWLVDLRDRLNPKLAVMAGVVTTNTVEQAGAFEGHCGNLHSASATIRGQWGYRATARIELIGDAAWRCSVDIECSPTGSPRRFRDSGTLPIDKLKLAAWFSDRIVDAEKHLLACMP